MIVPLMYEIASDISGDSLCALALLGKEHLTPATSGYDIADNDAQYAACGTPAGQKPESLEGSASAT